MTTRTVMTVTCDNCGNQQRTTGTIGWLTVTRAQFAIDVTRLGEKPFDGADLCSWACVANYATQAGAAGTS